ncbi:T9SS type A sorting domain-containing protein [Bacteroides nordii]|uniref:T9SS type A sorting domain-containing protein n=1 Tax=Bacteroides nordii TaxID=291645 RepID=UPI001F1BCD82|nr:T9SS type A sorting domain-containing protein [Bacteroides nordii]MCE8465370.1 T9SS type A sorting domain-containing protein [Bacteroides nordii]UYU47165.1 T9SS type A sorting domain-containing protein [Bacteroides nordii]
MGKYYFFAILLCSLTFSLKSQAAGFSGGKGTETEPYLIKTAQDLEDMADAITKDNQFADTYFQLANDIELEGTQFSIGSKSIPFKGSFDGNNKTISNLIIFPSGQNGSGLFGGTDLSAVIKNLTLASARIVSVGSEEAYYVAGICGYNKGKISNCIVKNSTIQGSKYVGGIAGNNIGGNIENCNFSGKASGGWWIGGIVGGMDKEYSLNTCGNITNCYNTGEIFGVKHVGGITGAFNNAGSLSQCYNMGSISISGGSEMGYDYETEAGVGGIAGFIASNAVIEKSVNFGKVESIQSATSSYVGGVVGRCYSAIVQKCYNTMPCKGNNYAYVGGIVGSYAGSSKLESCYTIAGGQSDYKAGMITPDPGSSLVASIKSCFYDKQMHRSAGGPGEGTLTKDMIGETLKEALGAEDWIYEEGMYPRLKGMETIPNAILTASPVICYSNADGSEFDRLDYLAHSISIPTGNSLSWKVDNTEYLKIENNQVTLLKRPTDELVSGTLTASLGDMNYSYPLSITADLGGDGSEGNPYQIKTAKQFSYFATMVAGGETYKGKYFKLINDLDMQGNKSTPSIPVGAKDNPFQGTFDGNKKVIDNFYYSTETTSAAGLFSYVGINGTIKDLTLGAGSYINGSMSIGGIVGQLGGVVYNCSNYAAIFGITGVGGIAGGSEYGANDGKIYNCYNAGKINSTRGNVGGIMGNNSALSINKCYNFGYVLVDGTGTNPTQAGGILGYTSKPVSDCINYGVVAHLFVDAATGNTKSVAGGIIGRTGGSKAAPAILKDCINVGSVIVTARGVAGAIAGTMAASDVLENCYYDSQMCTNGLVAEGATAVSTLNLTNGTALKDMSADTWRFANEQYPTLKDFTETDAAKLAATPVYLATGNNFSTISKSFKVGGSNETVWTSDNTTVAAINGKEVTITLPDETTQCNLTATYKNNSKTVCLFVLDKETGTGIKKMAVQTAFTVYANEETLTVENAANTYIRIFDASGKVCLQKEIINNIDNIQVPSAGLYIVKITKDQVSYTTKVVIE